MNINQSLEAAKRYEALGFSYIIATPHWIPGTRWAVSPAVIAEKVKEINSTLHRNNIALTILPGMEIAASEQMYELITSSRCLPLGKKSFFLVEFPLAPMVRSFSEQFFSQLTANKNLRFVIAHPERCPLFHENENLLPKLVKQGVHVQVNIASILGDYGRKIQQISIAYLKSGLVHFIATDSHARSNRMPPNNPQWNRLHTILGNEGIRAAFDLNPRQMLAGNDVAPLNINITSTNLAETGKGLINSFKRLLSRV